MRVDGIKKIWNENVRFLSKLTTIKSHYPVTAFKKDEKYYNRIKNNIQYNSSKLFVNLTLSDRFERNNFFLKLDKHGSILG